MTDKPKTKKNRKGYLLYQFKTADKTLKHTKKLNVFKIALIELKTTHKWHKANLP